MSLYQQRDFRYIRQSATLIQTGIFRGSFHGKVRHWPVRYPSRRSAFHRGAGTYIEDVSLDNETVGVFVRSRMLTRIVEIDRDSVIGLPGILAVYTGEDLRADSIGDVPAAPTSTTSTAHPALSPRPALAIDRVRHVGDAVALIVAETKQQALDAADQLWIDYEPLDATVETENSLSAEAPQIWDEARNNQCFHWESGKRPKPPPLRQRIKPLSSNW